MTRTISTLPQSTGYGDLRLRWLPAGMAMFAYGGGAAVAEVKDDNGDGGFCNIYQYGKPERKKSGMV